MGDDFNITGLEFERFPSTGIQNEQAKYLILATTPERLYQFVGGPNFLGVRRLFLHFLFPRISFELSTQFSFAMNCSRLYLLLFQLIDYKYRNRYLRII